MRAEAEPSTVAPVLLHFDIDLSYQVRSDGSDFIFNIQAARTRAQAVVEESLLISQPGDIDEYVDPNTSGRLLRLRAAAGPLRVAYSGTVAIHRHEGDPASIAETWIPNLPGPVLQFLYPSRYCESDVLNSFAMSHFGHLWQGYSRVQAICDWVQTHVAFTPESSVATTSARDTLEQRRGVCRDFAHLMIALCRAVNVPARFTTGLDYGADEALGPTDFHAYVEAWLGDRWYIFDPSGVAMPMGFVRLNSGRDAGDCAYASIFGDVVPLGRSLSIAAVPGDDGRVNMPVRTARALSTA